MIIYPYPKGINNLGVSHPDGGFTLEEINSGDHWLRTDVQCMSCHVMSCHLVQSLANAGSTDNGKCIRCGNKTE